MTIQEFVGKRIKEYRNKLGISQETLAHEADLDRTYLTSVENGRRNISIVNLEKITKALKITLSELFQE